MEILLAVMLYLNVKNICLVTTQRANGIFENFPEMKRSRSQSSLSNSPLSPSFSLFLCLASTMLARTWPQIDLLCPPGHKLCLDFVATFSPQSWKTWIFQCFHVNVGVKVVNPECYVVCKTSCQQKCSFHTKFTKGFPVFTLCLTPSL